VGDRVRGFRGPLHASQSASTPGTVFSPDVAAIPTPSLDLAEELGVKKFGVSVLDVATAEAACATGRYTYIQFPFNKTSTKFALIFDVVARNSWAADISQS